MKKVKFASSVSEGRSLDDHAVAGKKICGALTSTGGVCRRTPSCPFHSNRQTSKASQKGESAPTATHYQSLEPTTGDATNEENSSDSPRRSAHTEKGGDSKTKAKAEKQSANQRVFWTEEEHKIFLEGLYKWGKGKHSWNNISEILGTRTPMQVQTHAQKYYQYIEQGKYKKGSVFNLKLDDNKQKIKKHKTGIEEKDQSGGIEGRKHAFNERRADREDNSQPSKEYTAEDNCLTIADRAKRRKRARVYEDMAVDKFLSIKYLEEMKMLEFYKQQKEKKDRDNRKRRPRSHESDEEEEEAHDSDSRGKNKKRIKVTDDHIDSDQSRAERLEASIKKKKRHKRNEKLEKAQGVSEDVPGKEGNEAYKDNGQNESEDHFSDDNKKLTIRFGKKEREVERALAVRVNQGKQEYLIKWKGMSQYKNSWVDEDKIGSLEMLKNLMDFHIRENEQSNDQELRRKEKEPKELKERKDGTKQQNKRKKKREEQQNEDRKGKEKMNQKASIRQSVRMKDRLSGNFDPIQQDQIIKEEESSEEEEHSSDTSSDLESPKRLLHLSVNEESCPEGGKTLDASKLQRDSPIDEKERQALEALNILSDSLAFKKEPKRSASPSRQLEEIMLAQLLADQTAPTTHTTTTTASTESTVTECGGENSMLDSAGSALCELFSGSLWKQAS